MDLASIYLLIITLLTGVLLAYWGIVRQREESLKRKIQDAKDEIKKLQTELGKYRDILKEYKVLEQASEHTERIAGLLKKIKSKKFADLIEQTLESLEEGSIKLTIPDYFTFLTDLHDENDIVFFHVASRIDPRIWEENRMRLYQLRQIQNIEYYKDKSSAEKEAIAKMVADRLGERITNNFERIFIFDELERKNPEIVDSLLRVIKEQIEHMSIKIRCVPVDEKPMRGKPQDFGIVMTEKGDMLLVDLEVTEAGRPAGGRIVFDPEEIEKYWKNYKTISEKAEKVGY